jgi:hypothetical protein
MRHPTLLRVSTLFALLAGGAIVAAQVTLPSMPSRAFGASITPAYDGWFDNPDGTHSFLIGYYNRNTQEELDIPIGPSNRFEPGNPDLGQPTHFLPRPRRYGMFVVTVPKDFPRTQKVTWTLTANGVTTSIPFHMHQDYNLSPLKSAEESATLGRFNEPPVLRFAQGGGGGADYKGPLATPARAVVRTASVGMPMPIEIWAEDDALYGSGNNAPMRREEPPVTLTITKYRGPGAVKVERSPELTVLKGGKIAEPYAGRASTTATFSEPGEYMLHVTGNDFSGNGGGGSGCCWTTALIRVTVK